MLVPDDVFTWWFSDDKWFCESFLLKFQKKTITGYCL